MYGLDGSKDLWVNQSVIHSHRENRFSVPTSKTITAERADRLVSIAENSGAVVKREEWWYAGCWLYSVFIYWDTGSITELMIEWQRSRKKNKK